MRMYVAGSQHESSSFSPVPTGWSSFRVFQWTPERRDDEVGAGYEESCTFARELGWEVVAGPVFQTEPSLPATAEAWRQIAAGIIEPLQASGVFDIVFLCLHGAQMAHGTDDCEGDLLSRIRAVVGERTAIGVVLDLHANVSHAMLAAADLLVSCREYPHVDYNHRVREMLPVLADIARGHVRPTTVARYTALPGAYPTTEEPLRAYVDDMAVTFDRPAVLAVSLNHGFVGSDQPDMGSTVVVTTDNDPHLATSIADEMIVRFHKLVGSRSWDGLAIEAALDAAFAAFASHGGPVVVADRSDNSGGGAPSDSTFVLQALIERNVQNVALGMIWDPVAVEFCHAAGLGAFLPLRIGGKCGPMSGDPVDVLAEVISLSDDVCQGLTADPIGRAAAIRVDGIEIVLNTKRQQVLGHGIFTAHGIDVSTRAVVVIKSTQHFMREFGPIAAAVIRCDGPGTLAPITPTSPYLRVRRPMLGLDPIETIDIVRFAPIEPRARRTELR